MCRPRVLLFACASSLLACPSDPTAPSEAHGAESPPSYEGVPITVPARRDHALLGDLHTACMGFRVDSVEAKGALERLFYGEAVDDSKRRALKRMCLDGTTTAELCREQERAQQLARLRRRLCRASQRLDQEFGDRE